MVKSLVTQPTGDRIREARKAAGLSAEDLAYRLGISVGTVYRWEQGKHAPSLGKLRLVAALTEKPLAYFLETAEAAA